MNKQLVETVSIMRFILDNTKRKWCEHLEILIKIKYNKGDRFTIKDIYDNFEYILQQKFPKSNTVKNSIQLNLQKLRTKGIIEYIDYQGNYTLIS
tara:strand:- start:193 stop:477 length:285 start_codon:yes stop_codon:yes gene_type:complete